MKVYWAGSRFSQSSISIQWNKYFLKIHCNYFNNLAEFCRAKTGLKLKFHNIINLSTLKEVTISTKIDLKIFFQCDFLSVAGVFYNNDVSIIILMSWFNQALSGSHSLILPLYVFFHRQEITRTVEIYFHPQISVIIWYRYRWLINIMHILQVKLQCFSENSLKKRRFRCEMKQVSKWWNNRLTRKNNFFHLELSVVYSYLYQLLQSCLLIQFSYQTTQFSSWKILDHS